MFMIIVIVVIEYLLNVDNKGFTQFRKKAN